MIVLTYTIICILQKKDFILFKMKTCLIPLMQDVFKTKIVLNIQSSTLKKEAARCSETLVCFFKSTQPHIPEYSSLHELIF